MLELDKMQKRGAPLRENILWAAREVFLETGYEQASMDVVANRAGTTKRTLYAHFASKEDLFLAVFDFLNGFFLNRLRTPEAYSEDPAEALVLFCGRFMETLLWEGAIRMCRVCAAEATRFPEQSAQYCYVLFTEVEMRLAAYLRLKFGLSPRASAEAAQSSSDRYSTRAFRARSSASTRCWRASTKKAFRRLSTSKRFARP
jgi:AcrR family transcriptional regulator